MPTAMDLELAKAAYKVVKDLAKVKPGETLLITVDSMADFRPSEEIAKAGEALGAKVMLAWHSTPPGYGKVADPGLPDALRGAVTNTDVWIEMNNQWLLYSTPWEEAMALGRTRYLFLGGLNVEQIVRCIGKVEVEAQRRFQGKVTEMTRRAKRMRVTTPAGTDVSFENVSTRPVHSEISADEAGRPHFLLGQIAWSPLEESIHGTIVFDGSFSGGGEADLGILKHPITLIAERGKIVDIQGEGEAHMVKRWLESLNDPRMYYLAHICYGFNPGARLSGLCTEDERVWGCTEWGLGYQAAVLEGALGEAASHADGICLNSSVWMDGEQVMKEGQVIHPELVELAKACGK